MRSWQFNHALLRLPESIAIPKLMQSRECLEKTIQTMKVLGKPDEAIFLALTGASMRSAARELLDLRCAAKISSGYKKSSALGFCFIRLTAPVWDLICTRKAPNSSQDLELSRG